MTDALPVTDVMDVYIHLECGLLVIGDSTITDRHRASNSNYDADEPQNQIGKLIPVYPLLGRLRHGLEHAVRPYGYTASHPGETSTDFKKTEVYEHDLDDRDDEKGVCADESETDDDHLISNPFGA